MSLTGALEVTSDLEQEHESVLYSFQDPCCGYMNYLFFNAAKRCASASNSSSGVCFAMGGVGSFSEGVFMPFVGVSSEPFESEDGFSESGPALSARDPEASLVPTTWHS